MKKLYLLIITLFTTAIIEAQPTITQANFGPVIGESFTYNSFTPSTFTPGASGANASWNFSGTVGTGQISFTYVAPASTPYGSNFPTSNIASDQGGNYEYQNSTSTFLSRVGAYTSTGVSLPYSDEEKFIEFPFTFNSTFNDDFATTFVTSGYTFERTGTISVTADGYGTITTPSGSVNNVLRLHFMESYLDSSILGIQSYSSDNYAWITPGTHYFIYSISSFVANGITNLAGSYLDLSTGFNASIPSISKLNISPNPVNATINIETIGNYGNSAFVSITNLTGQNLLTSNFEIVAGQRQSAFDVSFLKAGIYFLNIRTDDGILTKRFIKE